MRILDISDSQKVVFSQKITRRNIVDRTKSPAFIAINTARRNLRELFNLDDVR